MLHRDLQEAPGETHKRIQTTQMIGSPGDRPPGLVGIRQVSAGDLARVQIVFGDGAAKSRDLGTALDKPS